MYKFHEWQVVNNKSIKNIFLGISSLDTVERYDPDLDEWKNIARMNKNRSAAGVVHLDGKIYALGGHNGLSIFESVEYYDTRTGGWEGKIDLVTYFLIVWKQTMD